MNLIQYFKESLAEFHRVTWPTRRTAIRSTIIVLSFTLITGVILAFVDYGFTEAFQYLLFRFF